MKTIFRRSFIIAILCVGLICILDVGITSAAETGRELNPGIDPASAKILQEMDTYVTPFQAFSMEVTITDEYVSSSGEKRQIQKDASLVVRRPDRLRAHVKFKDPERERLFFYNGKMLTMHDKTSKLYAQIDAPETTEKTLDFAMDRLGFTFPLVDFIFTNLYANLTANVFTSDYIGISQIKGVECHQLIFQQESIDWYLWIDVGEKPLPRKFMIVYKDEPKRSKFVAEFTGFKSHKKVKDNMFEFKPNKEDEKIDFLLVQEDEESTENQPEKDKPKGSESAKEKTQTNDADTEEKPEIQDSEPPKVEKNPATEGI